MALTSQAVHSDFVSEVFTSWQGFFVVANIQFTMSPLSHLAVLVNVYSQSTCSNHKGEMFTLTPLLSTIFFHFCLSPNTFVLPPHASQALSSCLVETQTISSIISRSQQLLIGTSSLPFFFFQYVIPLLCQLNWKKLLTLKVTTCDSVLQWITVVLWWQRKRGSCDQSVARDKSQ